jgi:hypothetical protein
VSGKFVRSILEVVILSDRRGAKLRHRAKFERVPGKPECGFSGVPWTVAWYG